MKNYNQVPIKVQKKSGFDKSFQNLFTSKVGTITPILVDELIPNSTVHLKAAISAALPPLASDTFMRCKLKYAAFFVPTRIIFPGYEQWLTGADANFTSDRKIKVPKICIPASLMNSTVVSDIETRKRFFGPGTLPDYLGAKFTNTQLDYRVQSGEAGYKDDVQLNALPFLAYHKIYNDWFRNSLVQKDILNVSGTEATYSPATSGRVTPCESNGYKITLDLDQPEGSQYDDGFSIYSLRQANFGYDLYTTASPQAQNGKAQAVTMTTIDNAQGFTISALRAANSMQQFLERNNLAGERLVDYVKAQYGANLSDSIAQRPILLGKGAFDVYSKGIYQTTPMIDDDGNGGVPNYQTQNPFNSVGARYGSPYADGQDTLVENFTAAEPGYLMVLAWLSPKVTYSTGIDPILSRYTNDSPSDMANPILQNVGNEPIYNSQLNSWSLLWESKIGGPNDKVFGYMERYGNWKDKQDEVHGLMRDGSSLHSFALQRTFNNSTISGMPNVSTGFLQIPTNFLDQVSAVSGDISTYGYWCDTFFDYKVSMPLAEYSVPSLQDPAYEHGVDITVNKGGTTVN